MRCLYYLTLGVAVAIASSVDPALDRRRPQGGNNVSLTSTAGSATQGATVTPTSSGTAASSSVASRPSSSASSISSITDASTQTSSSATSISTSSVPFHYSKNITRPGDKKSTQPQLPLTPKITPAVGLAGVILIATGLVYGLVGIKHKGICSFFSAAYLASLAVTSLIVYVMDPPVSDSIQGAFLVAIVACGLVFGGLSLIFNEITLGFGCILGGFCLSMWFLTLTAGGLIHVQTMRIVFIVVFMVVIGALSLFKVTREYGLIACLPFSGATAAILGVDCFSRAGMKEFWFYIWALNDDEFPVGTTTYPITRGMRVETAGIILLFLLGLATQLKLFKLVEKRRKRKEEDRMISDMEMDREHERVGKRVTKGLERDLLRWESIYGNKAGHTLITDSNETFANKDLSIIHEKQVEGEEVELADLGPARNLEFAHEWRRSATQKPAYGAGITITRPSTDRTVDTIEEIKTDGGLSSKPSREALSVSQDSGLGDEVDKTAKEEQPAAKRNSSRLSVRETASPIPTVTPLPFRIPSSLGTSSNIPSDRNSIPTTVESLIRRGSKRLSRQASSALKSLRSDESVAVASSSCEDLVEPPVAEGPDDAASSIAATIDDINDLDNEGASLAELSIASTSSRRASTCSSMSATTALEYRQSLVPLNAVAAATEPVPPIPSEFAAEGSSSKIVTDTKANEAREDGATEAPIEEKPIETTESNVDGEGAALDSTSKPKKEKRSSLISKRRRSGVSSPSGKKIPSLSIKSSNSSSTQNVTQDSLEKLPASLSKVVLNYRTNEWTKHLAVAEAPEQSIVESTSPGIQVDTVFQEELKRDRASVDPNSIVGGQAPLISYAGAGEAPPKTVPQEEAASATTSEVPNARLSRQSIVATNLISSHGDETYAAPAPRPESRGGSRSRSLSRPGSAFGQQPSYHRSASGPVLPATVTEEPGSAYRPPMGRRVGSITSPLHMNTLMDQRSNILHDRTSSATFAQGFTISPSDVSPTAAGQAAYFGSGGHGLVHQRSMDFDRSFTGQTRPGSAAANPHFGPRPSSRQASYTMTNPSPQGYHPSAGTMNLENFNSHQPKREADAIIERQRREAMYNTWRASLNREAAGSGSGVGVVGAAAASTLPMNSTPTADEGRRAAMMAEKRHETARAQQRQFEAAVRDSNFDTMMRRGGMLDLHREAMKKMQAGANTK